MQPETSVVTREEAVQALLPLMVEYCMRNKLLLTSILRDGTPAMNKRTNEDLAFWMNYFNPNRGIRVTGASP